MDNFHSELFCFPKANQSRSGDAAFATNNCPKISRKALQARSKGETKISPQRQHENPRNEHTHTHTIIDNIYIYTHVSLYAYISTKCRHQKKWNKDASTTKYTVVLLLSDEHADPNSLKVLANKNLCVKCRAVPFPISTKEQTAKHIA